MSIDPSRFGGEQVVTMTGEERDQQSRESYQGWWKGEGTYVERREIRAVTVKGCVVEIGELLSDSVDVCHDFLTKCSGEKARTSHGLIRSSDRSVPFCACPP